MRCPTCVEEGQRSRVYLGMTITTAMAAQAYFDEDGKRHVHDPNTSTTELSCSQGHRWVEERKYPCPSCDYGRAS